MINQFHRAAPQQVVRAREAERTHIARELHDQIIQTLIGLTYELSHLRGSTPEVAERRLSEVQAQLRDVTAMVRQVCADLREPALDQLGLAATVRGWIRERERRYPFRVTLQILGDERQPLPDDAALCVFRVMQEALSNVFKHASAAHVLVCLLLGTDHIALVVQDDGVGFREPTREQREGGRHFGLSGMYERADLAGGTLTIETRPSAGACVRLHVPLATFPAIYNRQVSYERARR